MLRVLAVLLAVAASQGACTKEKDGSANQDGLVAYRGEVAPGRKALGKERPSWLEMPPACPTAWMPSDFEKLAYALERCSGDGLGSCLDECKRERGDACYASALTLQGEASSPEEEEVAVALFARSCKLGGASGCTNWGASIDMGEANSDERTACLRKTFETTCLAGKDPWGCTMFGYAVADEGIDKGTIDKLALWSKTSCSFGEDDPACASMHKLIRNATEALARFPDAGPTP